MEKTKAKRIHSELLRLKRIYAALPPETLRLYETTLRNAAFMAVTLEDLQISINEEGVWDVYQNGKEQSGRKISANVQAYNQMVKNYKAVIDQLDKLLSARTADRKVSKLTDVLSD